MEDCCGDVSALNHDNAMRRMVQAGARSVTALSTLLEWQRDWAQKDTYDAVMDIVKAPAPTAWASSRPHMVHARATVDARRVWCRSRRRRTRERARPHPRQRPLHDAGSGGSRASRRSPSPAVASAPPAPRDILPTRGPDTEIIDLGGRRVIPGLIDSHMHVIRGGLNYNMELRWDGVPSLADAMAMLKRQVAITPPPQWVRVVGGFTEQQFAEKRLPTLDELNAASPDTPVFILHLYDRALLNQAALRVVGYTKDTPSPPGGEIQRDGAGNPTGLLLARPNANILYATLARGPKLPPDYQLNSTRHFMRELNRLGVTGAIDAGGGFQNYPEDYEIIEKLHADGQLTIRIAYNLFTQKPGGEVADFTRWTGMVSPGQATAIVPTAPARAGVLGRRFRGFPRTTAGHATGHGGGPRGRASRHPRWPWRLHATYDGPSIAPLRKSTATSR